MTNWGTLKPTPQLSTGDRYVSIDADSDTIGVPVFVAPAQRRQAVTVTPGAPSDGKALVEIAFEGRFDNR